MNIEKYEARIAKITYVIAAVTILGLAALVMGANL